VGVGWIEAWKLTSGTQVLCADGSTVTLEAIVDTGEWLPVFNLRIADHHTYFVGDEAWGFSVWSHNACVVLYRYSAPGQPVQTKHWRIKTITDDPGSKTNFTEMNVDPDAEFPTGTELKPWLKWHPWAVIEEVEGTGANAEARATITLDNSLVQKAFDYAESRKTSGQVTYDLISRSCFTYIAQVLNKAGYSLAIPAKRNVAQMDALLAELNRIVEGK
jgi:hypothetical protein